MNNWFHFFFKKRLSLSLFLVLPAVAALTAFASGFIALVLADRFFDQHKKNIPQTLLAEGMETLHYVKLETLGFTLLGLVVGLGIAYAILHPLRRLMAGARQIAQGDFSASLETENLDELGVLGKDFNFMVSSLNKYFLDTMTAGWILIDKTGKIVSVNPGAQAILGCRSEELVGGRFQELSRYVCGGKGFGDLISDTIENQKPCASLGVDLVTAAGRKIRASLSTTILKSAEDIFVGVAATIKDLTRAGEIAEHMQRADRLAAMGTMAAGLAHEIRNPLGAIRGLTQLLHEKFAEGDKSRAYTQTMIKEIDRLDGVVSSLLNFAHSATGEFQFCDVNSLLDQALNLAGLDMEKEKKGTRVTKTLSPSLPPLWADGRKLTQAFLNVLLNAFQATSGREAGAGEIRVATRFDPDLFAGAGRGGGIVVEIANSGPPVDPAVADRIFEPFVTTKKQGTGLGLTITQQIVAMHGGEVFFALRGGFTAFVLEFPAAEVLDSVEADGRKKR